MYLKTFFVKNTYLSNLDNLNKYVTKSVYVIPKVKAITLTMFLHPFILATEIKNVTIKDKGLQIKAFLTLYLVFTFIPYLKSKRFSLKKLKTSELNSDYSLTITLTRATDLNEFLVVLFIENRLHLLGKDSFFRGTQKKLSSPYLVRTAFNLAAISPSLLPSLTLAMADEVACQVSFEVRHLPIASINFSKPFSFKNLPLLWHLY